MDKVELQERLMADKNTIQSWWKKLLNCGNS